MVKNRYSLFLYPVISVAGGILILLAACGGGGGNGGGTSGVSPSTTGSVVTSISDPPTCLAPAGPFSNVWITITQVRAHLSSSAGPNDSGWVNLVDFRTNPTQIDLLNLSSTACILAQLASTSGIPPGRYQQIRLHLLTNTPPTGQAIPTSNHCGGNGFNCVVTSGGANQMILLSSEAQNGIKISSGQIAGGAFSVTAGQPTNLNIDFDACSSLVQQGNGLFRLKPVIHAGAISLNSNSLSGVVVDSLSKAPIAGAFVFAELPDPANSNIDRVIAQTTTGPLGEFTLCPLPAGTYDVVAAGQTVFFTYNPTVTLGVPLGTAMGNVPLIPQSVKLPATVDGQITAASSGGSPTTVDVNISALQPVGNLLVTIPPLGNSSANVTTENGIMTFTLILSPGNPQFGTFSASPATLYTPPLAGPALYQLNAQAFFPANSTLNPAAPDCNPSSVPTFFSGATQLLVTPGATAIQNFAFVGCQ